MTRILIILLTLTFTLNDSRSQDLSEKEEKKIEKALKEWFENPSFDNETLDPRTIEQLTDSGMIQNGLKEGLWVEFSLDTSLKGQETTIVVGDNQFPMDLGATLQKEVGKYSKGDRQGLWTLYRSYDKKAPLLWSRTILTQYAIGEKHGKNILLSFNDTILIQSFVHGKEQGIGKMFDVNYPHKLQKRYNAMDGKYWLLEDLETR